MTGCSGANCAAPGDGVRTRVLKDFAFHVVGTDTEAREPRLRSRSRPGLAGTGPGDRRRTVIAPEGEHRPLHAVGTDLIEGLVAGARDALATARDDPQTEYLTVVQNWGAQGRAAPTTSVSTCTTCPRSRIASPRSSVARPGSSSGGVPVLPLGPR